jgi:hypothetical protein
VNQRLSPLILILISIFVLGIQPIWGQKITRNPYLQEVSPKAITIRYRTDMPTSSHVQYSTNPKSFTQAKVKLGQETEHTIRIDSLEPNSTYYYRIITANNSSLGDSTYFFKTAPKPGSKDKFSVWCIGDMYPGITQTNVYEGFKKFTKGNYTNLFLTVGDNVYGGGTDADFQTNFFNVYEKGPLLKQSPLFPSIGNHDYDAYAKNQDNPNMAYFQNFSLPTNGQSGGLASSSEAYYSFDYGNAHFICLDSYAWGRDNMRIFDGPSEQLTWLKNDLKANKYPWVIVYFHYPPYTKGTYDSDIVPELTKLREILTPVFDEFNVDMVISGHSHVFERSRPLNGLKGPSSEFNKKINWTQNTSGKYDKSENSCPFIFQTNAKDKNGVIYVVNGVGGATGNPRAGYPHPVMEYSLAGKGGSFYFEIENKRLDAKFIDEEGKVLDQFTVMKDFKPREPISQTINYLDKIELSASWQGDYQWSTGEKLGSVKVSPTEKSSFTVSDPQGCFQEKFTIDVNPPLSIQQANEEINDAFDSLQIYNLQGQKIKDYPEAGRLSQRITQELNPGKYLFLLEKNGIQKVLKIAISPY